MRQKYATCKRAYLCDMLLLHAVARKLDDFNFLVTACKSHVAQISPFTQRDFVARRMFLSHRVNAP